MPLTLIFCYSNIRRYKGDSNIIIVSNKFIKIFISFISWLKFKKFSFKNYQNVLTYKVFREPLVNFI